MEVPLRPAMSVKVAAVRGFSLGNEAGQAANSYSVVIGRTANAMAPHVDVDGACDNLFGCLVQCSDSE